MNINDMRHKKQELSFDDLEAGKVYVSCRFQKYVMKILEESNTICLETGEVFD